MIRPNSVKPTKLAILKHAETTGGTLPTQPQEQPWGH